MSKEFSLRQLTEGIRDRNLASDHSRLISKWTRTGLLRGLNEHKRETMSRLLENQAAQVLREANVLGTSNSSPGNINGFSNIAFPIVRRVFGGLVANELVSIQPMSLPSGLLFYLDYTYGSDIGHKDSGGASDVGNMTAQDSTSASVYNRGDSLYGLPSGKDIQAGATALGGMYDLAGSSYSKAYRSVVGVDATFRVEATETDNCGAFAAGTANTWTAAANIETTNPRNLQYLQYDPQILKEINENGTAFSFLLVKTTALTGIDKSLIKGAGLIDAGGTASDINGLSVFANDTYGNAYQQGTRLFNLRRLNQIGTWDTDAHTFTVKSPSDSTATDILMVVKGTASALDYTQFHVTYPKSDSVAVGNDGAAGSTLTIPSFESDFTAGDPNPIIPEIDIKIESIAVTAQTRKLRARWSPELAQDLNAYHSMDAEVELTQILSEQIALEIDREILNDLLVEAKAANYYWSRAPGKFVKKNTGSVASSTIGPNFTGTVREWYETLVETIIDVANEIHRKTLRGAANFIVVSPEVATIFESSVLYKPSIKLDGQGQVGTPFSIGAEAVGSLSNRFTVYKDPYFPRNKILVGYKGGSYLESGYVYAPYVPLIVTPTIFAPEDFTPRKGVMTRYGKKMVRADFYGTVTCLDMDII